MIYLFLNMKKKMKSHAVVVAVVAAVVARAHDRNQIINFKLK